MSPHYHVFRAGDRWVMAEDGIAISEHRTERDAAKRAEACNRYANRERA